MVKEKDQGGPLPSSSPGIIPFIDVKWRPRDKIRAKEIYEQRKQSLELQILPDLTSLYLLLPLLHPCTCLPLSQLSLLEPASSTSESWTPQWGRCPPRTTVIPIANGSFSCSETQRIFEDPKFRVGGQGSSPYLLSPNPSHVQVTGDYHASNNVPCSYPSRISECDLNWNRILRYPKSNDWYPYKKWRHRHGQEGQVKAVSGRQRLKYCVHKLRDTSSQPKWGERHEIFSPSALPRRNHPCLGLDFGLLASWTVREHISVVLSYRVCGRNLRQWHMERGFLTQHKRACKDSTPTDCRSTETFWGTHRWHWFGSCSFTVTRVQTHRYSEPASRWLCLVSISRLVGLPNF